MIEIKNLTKRFGKNTAVDQVSFTIRERSIFGLIGTNGAGKSTLLRMAAGILKPEEGEVLLDGENVYENPKAKEKFFYVSDDPFYFANSTPCEMKKFYQSVYPDFDQKRFEDFMVRFQLGQTKRIHSYSKGMKKQLAILLAVCANTKYIYFDETFDGLDPVMRQAVKAILAGDMEERGLTPMIDSHNLRELEDICDHVGLLHKGGILLSRDLEEMKCRIHKIQCVIPEEEEELLEERLDIMKKEKRGSLFTMTVKGDIQEIEEIMKESRPVFYDILPLSLEEIFISETEVAGYDIKNLIF